MPLLVAENSEVKPTCPSVSVKVPLLTSLLAMANIFSSFSTALVSLATALSKL